MFNGAKTVLIKKTDHRQEVVQVERLTAWLAGASGTCGMIHGPMNDKGVWRVLLTSKNLQNHRPHSILRDAKSFSQVCRVTDLSFVERWVTGPLKHVLVDVAIISSEDRIQLHVVEVEGIDQRHGVGSQLTEQFLDTSRNLQHLGHRQQSSLRKRKQKWMKRRPRQTTCRRPNNTTPGGAGRA